MSRPIGIVAKRGGVPILAALVLGVAACSTAPAPQLRPPSGDAYTACLRKLTDQKVVFEPIKDFHTPQGCGVTGGIKESGGPVALSRPTILTCEMATRLLDFELQVLQPLARRYFGREVVRVDHAGSYACRPIHERPEQLSQHAFGKAIDIMGFELADGRKISVLKDWHGNGPKAAYLHEVARRSCDMFSVTLTPNADADHHDHIHLDIGPYHYCGY